MRECISRYGPLVWSIARRFAPDASDEATKEIFVELWKHAGRFDPRAGSEPVFIAMIARRCMLDRLRSIVPRPKLKPAPDSLASSEQHTASERCVEAATAAGVLATLDPRQRRILSLAVGQGMTHEEIAGATATQLGTVKSLVRRALIAVRKRLSQHEGVP
ncbi:RNA polymerase sigma factor [Enhygromyxa salina]|uniref:ECF RNA polymerase sigma factor SigK n=1 Tax=Enhygromyxa salina TaxID=215803 RepID=A0A2S9YNC2_9BACT|nr:sigma-70 family RNA polymerase sigma factor [Enhygromyxa salina]PRQ06593.1 ECF RNA polymerase sigma factor SigK [Enhygromyxa salina]